MFFSALSCFVPRTKERETDLLGAREKRGGCGRQERAVTFFFFSRPHSSITHALHSTTKTTQPPPTMAFSIAKPAGGIVGCVPRPGLMGDAARRRRRRGGRARRGDTSGQERKKRGAVPPTQALTPSRLPFTPHTTAARPPRPSARYVTGRDRGGERARARGSVPPGPADRGCLASAKEFTDAKRAPPRAGPRAKPPPA